MMTGGRRKDALLGDAMEAVIAAVYLDAGFATARAMGYSGVSTKACKGVWRSLLNLARCRAWNAEAGTARFFMSAEDLTTLAGVC